jgi:hypothetical protein
VEGALKPGHPPIGAGADDMPVLGITVFVNGYRPEATPGGDVLIPGRIIDLEYLCEDSVLSIGGDIGIDLAAVVYQAEDPRDIAVELVGIEVFEDVQAQDEIIAVRQGEVQKVADINGVPDLVGRFIEGQAADLDPLSGDPPVLEAFQNGAVGAAKVQNGSGSEFCRDVGHHPLVFVDDEAPDAKPFLIAIRDDLPFQPIEIGVVPNAKNPALLRSRTIVPDLISVRALP